MVGKDRKTDRRGKKKCKWMCEKSKLLWECVLSAVVGRRL